jgi:hypothetical protein
MALTRAPAAAPAPAASHSGTLSRSVAAVGGAALIVLGAAPMAVAQASPNADPILARSIAGPSVPLDYPATLRAFDRREGLDHVPGWLYLTGTLAQLDQVWHGYGITAQDLTATPDTEEAYVIDAAGRVRQRFSTSPGPGTAAIRSSFAVLFANAARQALSGR